MKQKKDIHQAVFGIFKTKESAERAVDVLKASGFRSNDVSVLFSSGQMSENFAHKKATKVPEGTATGVTSGVIIGSSLGWLAGIGSLAIPGVGPFVAAGPIMAALAGAGVGGTVGGIVGALIGIGIPEYEAKRFEGFIKDGGILLSVHVDDADLKKSAKEILDHCGAEDIDSESEVRNTTKPETRVGQRP